MTNVRFFTELNYKDSASECEKYIRKSKVVPGTRHIGIYFDDDKDTWIAFNKNHNQEITSVELFSWDDVSNYIHDII